MNVLQYYAKCKVLRCIASGGMGNIYLAEQIGSNGFRKRVAIKCIKSDLLYNKEILDMFIGEANLLANLFHENIIQVYNFEEIDGCYYLIMEYVEGPNLENFIDRHKFIKRNIPPNIGAFVIYQIVNGLCYIHKKRDKDGNRLKIVHRDISPSNIIITNYGTVKLTDFGIAKALTMKVPDERVVIMGKYSYMSPEQALCEITDLRSDIFSLGLVAYELLSGRKVYSVNDDEQLLKAMKRRIIPLYRVNTAIPKKLNTIIMKALDKDPYKRFQTTIELRENLLNFLYETGFMPRHEKLAEYLELLFPETKRLKSIR